MPILSIYFGMSEVSVLVFENTGSYRNLNYPFAFLNNKASPEELIKIISKDVNIPVLDMELLTCGFPYVPDCGTKPALTATLEKIISSTSGFSGYFVDKFKLITPRSYTFAQKVGGTEGYLPNHLANLSIYPQMTTIEPLDTASLDDLVRFYDIEMPDTSPVVFTGGRFSAHANEDPFTYLLMLDLLKSPGVYEVRVDDQNVFAGLALLSIYDKKYSHVLLEHSFKTVGTLMNVPGGVECYIEADEGTTQFIEVGDETLFLVPTLGSLNTRVVVRNQQMGSFERYVSGGALGLIIDTRNKSSPEVFNKAYEEKNIKEWVNSIEEVLTGL
jgi:hypothetical protein